MDRFGIPFDYIEQNWTDREFFNVVEALEQVAKRETGTAHKQDTGMPYKQWLKQRGIN